MKKLNACLVLALALGGGIVAAQEVRPPRVEYPATATERAALDGVFAQAQRIRDAQNALETQFQAILVETRERHGVKLKAGESWFWDPKGVFYVDLDPNAKPVAPVASGVSPVTSKP